MRTLLTIDAAAFDDSREMPLPRLLLVLVGRLEGRTYRFERFVVGEAMITSLMFPKLCLTASQILTAGESG